MFPWKQEHYPYLQCSSCVFTIQYIEQPSMPFCWHPTCPHTCCIFLSLHQVLLLRVCWSGVCLPDPLGQRTDPRWERWCWSRWLLPPNCSRRSWETSALAMHQQLQRASVGFMVQYNNQHSVFFLLMIHLINHLFLTCNRPVVIIKVYPNTSSFPPTHPAAPAAAQRDRHNTIHIRQHDGDPDACREETWSCSQSPVERIDHLINCTLNKHLLLSMLVTVALLNICLETVIHYDKICK